MSSEEMLGPVDYLVVEFPADKANFSGEMATELASLVERGLVRVLDLVLLVKKDDGSVEAAELSHTDAATVGELLSLEPLGRAVCVLCATFRRSARRQRQDPDASPPRCDGVRNRHGLRASRSVVRHDGGTPGNTICLGRGGRP